MFVEGRAVVKIMVLLKRTPDTEARIKLSADGKTIDAEGVQHILNPYDEFAIEEALQIKEKLDGEVIACSYGAEANREIIVRGLAMGADRGLLITADATRDSLGISKVLAKAVEKEQPDLVFCGKQGIDDDNMHVGVMVAEYLGWPHVNVVNKLTLNDRTATIEREVEGGQVEVYETPLPLIVGANKALNSPRYVSLPGIMKAKRKTLDVLSVTDLGVDAAACKSEIIGYQYPPEKPPGKLFKDKPLEEMVDEVVRLLREEAKVI